MTSAPSSRLAQAGPRVASSAIAGIGISRPSAEARLAPRVSGVGCTGVAYRVHSAEGVSTASLAAEAARAAIAAARIAPGQIELIVVGTTSPDVLWPATACLVQTELGLPMVGSFDLYAAQASQMTAFNVATRYVAAGARAALVIGAESDNQLVDLPGQGGGHHGRAASAVVLAASGGEGAVLASLAGGAGPGHRDGAQDDGAVLRELSDGVRACLGQAGLRLSDVDLVIGEQSAPEVMRAWRSAAGLPAQRLLLEPSRYGALVAAAPLIAAHDAVVEGRLRPAMVALILSCGQGPVWAVACIRWGKTEVAA